MENVCHIKPLNLMLKLDIEPSMDFQNFHLFLSALELRINKNCIY